MKKIIVLVVLCGSAFSLYGDYYDSQKQGIKNDNTQREYKENKSNDAEIRKEIYDIFYENWFGMADEQIFVDVTNGNVTLKGIVNSEEAKNKIDSRIRKIKGVRNLDNKITITNKDSEK